MLTKEELKSDNDVNLTVSAVYQRNTLSIISKAFSGFHALLTPGGGQSETLKSFEMLFSAAVTKCHSFSKTSKFPQYIPALTFSSKGDIGHSQPVSVLAAAASP